MDFTLFSDSEPSVMEESSVEGQRGREKGVGKRQFCDDTARRHCIVVVCLDHLAITDLVNTVAFRCAAGSEGCEMHDG